VFLAYPCTRALNIRMRGWSQPMIHLFVNALAARWGRTDICAQHCAAHVRAQGCSCHFAGRSRTPSKTEADKQY
jgi:hypothetical protein